MALLQNEHYVRPYPKHPCSSVFCLLSLHMPFTLYRLWFSEDHKKQFLKTLNTISDQTSMISSIWTSVAASLSYSSWGPLKCFLITRKCTNSKDPWCSVTKTTFMRLCQHLCTVCLRKTCPDTERHNMRHKDMSWYVVTRCRHVFVSLCVLPLLGRNTICLYEDI